MKISFQYPSWSLTSSPHITMLHAGSVGGQKGTWLGSALVTHPFSSKPQLVHQVGLACAVGAHDSHHHNRLPDGRQDLQSFWISQQLPIGVLNEALWGWHVISEAMSRVFPDLQGEKMAWKPTFSQ